MASMESDILDNLKALLDALSWQKVVEFEKIKLLITDFREHELPAVQFYDAGQTSVSSQGRNQIDWLINVEIVMKRTSTDLVDQGILLDRAQEIRELVGSDVQLGLGSAPATQGTMVHIKYVSGISDFHTLEPFFIYTLTFNVRFYAPYTGIC